MNKMRQWSLLAGLAVVAVLAAGWFLLVSPKRGEASDLRAQAVSQEQQNVQLQAKLEQLKAQAKDLPAQQAKLADFHLRIPDNPALPTLVRDLTKATKAAGTDLVSLAPGQPAALTPAAGTQPVAPSAGGAAAKPATATSPLFAVPVQLHVTGTYPQVELFINQLESLKRSFLVTGFQLGESKESGAAGDTTASTARTLDLQLDGRVFVAPTTATPVTAVKPVASPAPAPAK
ncbi:MAG: type 4a pilus biogenesis protein PilO [Motilibacteraceae bacterium]